MPGVKMIVSALSDVGRARTTNEDAFTITDLASGRTIEAIGDDQAIDVQDRGVLLALSDGMGGAEAGEVASALVLDSLQKALEREARGAIHEQLESAVQRANRNVFLEAKLGDHHGMGATLVAMFLRGDEAYIAEVGDSRGYLLRKGRLRQITRDQSLVQLLVDQGVMSADEARSSPSKNVILQAMGLAKDVRVAIARLRLRRGDRLLMCSDGITNPISDAELLQILTQSDPRAACETMIALANDRGGDDNQTAIVADLTGDDLPLPDEFETVTETYEVLKRYDATYKGRAVTPEVARSVGDAVRARSAAKAAKSSSSTVEPTPEGMPPAGAPAPREAPAPAASEATPPLVSVAPAVVAPAAAPEAPLQVTATAARGPGAAPQPAVGVGEPARRGPAPIVLLGVLGGVIIVIAILLGTGVL